MALVDARYKFTVVDIGSYGRNSDGGIFAHSKLGKYLETYLGIPEVKQLPGIQKIKVPNWKTLAQDRRRWKELVEKAKTL